MAHEHNYLPVTAFSLENISLINDSLVPNIHELLGDTV